MAPSTAEPRGRLHLSNGQLITSGIPMNSHLHPAHSFSLSRFRAMVVKEFVQMRRDRMTFGMMIGIPLIQLVLFGFAINSDPKSLPAAVLLADHGPQGRTLLSAIQNSGYFEFVRQLKTEAEAHDVLARGEALF